MYKRHNPLTLAYPYSTFLAHFWNCIRLDISGQGCTTDDLPPELRRLPYAERVMIEREGLTKEAALFLDTPDFDWWAEVSGINPDVLREGLRANSKLT
jgi:hypothetical protein